MTGQPPFGNTNPHPPAPPKTRITSTNSYDKSLIYFRKALKKRFPQKTMVDIDIAIERSLEAMHPCRNRTILNRAVIALLSESPSATD
jgi:hypothetical protein